jgi:hypothetical protein
MIKTVVFVVMELVFPEFFHANVTAISAGGNLAAGGAPMRDRLLARCRAERDAPAIRFVGGLGPDILTS